MKFSNNTIIYPINRVLERAIAGSLGVLSEELVEAAAPDTQVTVADNFLFTRGNYEQHSFNSSILEPLSEALESALTGASLIGQRRDQEPLAWAETQNRLGNILAALGQQQGDVELYEKAIQCFNNATKKCCRCLHQCFVGLVARRITRRVDVYHASVRRYFSYLRKTS